MQRSWVAMARRAMTSGARAVSQAVGQSVRRSVAGALKPAAVKRAASAAASAPAGDWIAGVAIGIAGSAGTRRFRLYRPPQLQRGEQLPLLVMLHGCGQDANSFAASTRMNRIALRERFFVLYPEQDRLANVQGCWNWFDTRNGRADREAALIMSAIEQVCLLHPVNRERVAVAGLSAGASMAALLVATYPSKFKAVVMHSGIAPGMAHSSLSALGAMRGSRGTPSLARSACTMAAVSSTPSLGRAPNSVTTRSPGGTAGTAMALGTKTSPVPLAFATWVPPPPPQPVSRKNALATMSKVIRIASS